MPVSIVRQGIVYYRYRIVGRRWFAGKTLINEWGKIVVTDKDIVDFSRDGVAFLRGAFDQDWIDILRQGIEENIANPSERARIWNRDAQGRTCFYDSQVWRDIEAYEDFALNSPCAPNLPDLSILCEEAWQRGKIPVRLLGVGVRLSDLTESGGQLELFDRAEESK